MSALRLLTLGLPRVYLEDEELTSFTRKPLRSALLFYVAVEERTSRASVLGVLWPERSEDRARHALSQTLYEVRKDLGDDVIDTVGEELRIRPDVRVDVREFEEALESEDYERACELYRGPFLDTAGFADSRPFEGWVDAKRSRLTRLHRVAARERVSELAEGGEAEAALAVARRWATLEPLDDEAQHAVVELLARTGDRTGALRWYESYRELLAEELEVEPLAETRELVARVREGGYEAAATDEGSRGSAATLGTGGRGDAEPADEEEAPAADRESAAGSDEAELAPGFVPVRTLGVGEWGEVRLAREPALKRLVALKILKPELARDSTAVRRFLREAESSARIHHPNVITVHRVGTLPTGAPYLVMPYFPEGSVEDKLRATGPFDAPEALRVLRDVAAGLRAAHGLGIVHRDVKPGNVLVDPDGGRYLLTDFGIAALLETGDASVPRLTEPGVRLGNPRYSSPEHLEGTPLTDRADVYGIGLLALAIFSGREPMAGCSERELIRAHLEGDAPRLSEVREGVDDRVDDLVARCLHRNPSHRPSAEEVVQRLDDIVGPVSSPSPG